MPLDFAKLLPQVDLMACHARNNTDDYAKRLALATSKFGLKGAELADLRERVFAASKEHKSTWLMAGIRDGIGNRYRSEDCPPEFYVVASDGSHIEIDRNHSARCFLINTSLVVLCYGSNPAAEIEAWPDLSFDDDSLTLKPGDGNHPPQLIQGPLLGVKRAVDECRRLADGAESVGGTAPMLALLDGSLTLWSLTGKDIPTFVRDAFLKQGLLVQLDRLRELGRRRPLGLVSFISFPRSTEVANSLRVSFCPYEQVDCDKHCQSGSERPCRVMDGILDRDIFEKTLATGERSDLFTSLSSISTDHYGPHAVAFFYLRLEDELTRVELPIWVAADPQLLSLTHSLLLDQCRRGLGYPVALSESHEAAVLSGRDRDQFWQIVENTLYSSGIPVRQSAKSNSKRTRAL